MTSKELRKEIASEVDKIPIVDPHTHLREDDLSSHVVDILSYHWILSELNSVGMDYEKTLMNKDLDLDTRLKSVIPYFAKMRNTATARCVYNIFKGLYGFHDPLNEGNYKQLLDLSIKNSSENNWPDKVFQKANLNRFATSVGNASKTGKERNNFSLMVDLHYLFWPAGATDLLPWFGEFAGDETRYLEALEKIGGCSIVSIKDVRQALQYFITGVNNDRVKFFNTFVPIEFRFCKVDDSTAEHALQAFKKSKGRSKQDLEILVSFVTWHILEILNELNTTLQIAVGAEYFICGGRSISRFESTWVSDMVKICYVFPKIKFDFMNASYVMNHEMAVAAKMIRNFYIQNMWWHTYVPSCINLLYDRLEIVPVVKLGGFYCDAYYCELTYGKLMMVKSTIIDVLSNKVENNIYSFDYAIEVANTLLNKNPQELYYL
jgi:hypothetical protein